MDELKSLIDSMKFLCESDFQELSLSKDECEKLYPILKKIYDDYFSLKEMLQTTLDNYLLIEKGEHE